MPTKRLAVLPALGWKRTIGFLNSVGPHIYTLLRTYLFLNQKQ